MNFKKKILITKVITATMDPTALLVYIVTLYLFNTLGDCEYGEHEVVVWEDIPDATTTVVMTKFQAFVVARKLATANPDKHVVIRECVVGQENQRRTWVNYPEPEKFLRQTVVDGYDADGDPLEPWNSEDKTALPYTE